MGASRGGAHGGVAGKPPRLVLSPEVGAGERASPLQSFCPILASITADLIPGGLDVGLVSRRQHHGGFFLSLCKDQKSGARGVCGTFMPEAQGARPSRPRSLAGAELGHCRGRLLPGACLARVVEESLPVRGGTRCPLARIFLPPNCNFSPAASTSPRSDILAPQWVEAGL